MTRRATWASSHGLENSVVQNPVDKTIGRHSNGVTQNRDCGDVEAASFDDPVFIYNVDFLKEHLVDPSLLQRSRKQSPRGRKDTIQWRHHPHVHMATRIACSKRIAGGRSIHNWMETDSKTTLLR